MSVDKFRREPGTLLTLSNLKVAADWNQPLWASPPAPDQAVDRGLPVQWSPAVDEDVIWGIHKPKCLWVLGVSPASIVTEPFGLLLQ